MNGEKKDLRYSRTDRLLQEAFLELLKVKSVDRITIRDLTERADQPLYVLPPLPGYL